MAKPSATLSNVKVSPTKAFARKAGWVLICAIVWTPWAYGGIPPWSIYVLDALLALAVLSYVPKGLRSVLHNKPIPLFLALLLLIQAWLSLGFGDHVRWTAPLHATLLLLTAWLAAELGRSSIWRKRLWWAMSLAGSGVILLGLIQRLTDAPGIFWDPSQHYETFFATFNYHANAGSFMNLIWPLTAGLAVLAFVKAQRLSRRILWVLLWLFGLVGIVVNTSRGAGAIAAGLLVIVLVWFLLQVKKGAIPGLTFPVAFSAVMLLLILAGGIAFALGLEQTLWHWSVFKRNELSPDNPRLLSAQLCLRMIPEAGFLGSGPGTFARIYLPAAARFNIDVPPNLEFAHNDYLQTILEWGWAGAAAWFCLVIGAIGFGLREYRRHAADWRRRDRIFFFVTLVALLGVFAHAAVDYPLQVSSIQLYAAVLLGLLCSTRSWKHSEA